MCASCGCRTWFITAPDSKMSDSLWGVISAEINFIETIDYSQQTMISSERESQEEWNGTNFISLAPSSEELQVW